MSLLAPIFLAGLLALAIPLAIHLIRRDKPEPLPFSSLRFFQSTTRKQFLFQNFQQWLLLALRALALALLAFAFARPFFSQTFSGWVDLAPRSVVVAIDNSMSMGYGDQLRRAQSEAENVLDELKPGDEATLVVFADEVTQVVGPTTDKQQLRAAIGALQHSHSATRFFPPLVLASEILDGAQFDDQSVYLISDFQNTGMTDFDQAWRLAPGVNFFPIAVGSENSRNLAITGVKVPSIIRSGNTEQELFVRVRSMGNVAESQTRLNLAINDKPQQSRNVEFGEQAEVVVALPFAATEEGSLIGSLTVDDSFFALDNQYLFTLDVLPKIPVLVVNGDPSTNWFDDEGHWFNLAVGGEQSPFAATVIDTRQLRDDNLAEFDVIVLLNVGSLETRQAQAIENFVRQGGSVLLAPGDRVQAGLFNRQLAAISPATLIESRYLANNDYLLIADIETRHPILKSLERNWAARFDGHWAMKPADNAEVLMTFDNGEAALVERNVDAGRALVFASSLDLQWNNLPLQGMYLPFVHEMLKHLAQATVKQPSYNLGDVIDLPRGKVQSIRSPSGAELLTDAVPETLRLTEAGLYNITLGSSASINNTAAKQIVYAVNPPREESNLLSVDADNLFDAILNPETKPTQSAAMRTQLLKQEIEKPQRIWWWLLMCVALLLVAELLLANRTYR